MLMQRQETEGPWVKFPKAWYEELPVLDLVSLNGNQISALDTLWLQIQSRDLLTFREIAIDKVRRNIDDVFCEILGIPTLDNLRDLLSREPVICMQPL